MKTTFQYYLIGTFALFLAVYSMSCKTEPPADDTHQRSGASSAATFENCQQWIESSTDFLSELPAMTCSTMPEFARETILNNGAGIFPVGDNMYYVVWFPENWETKTDQKIIFALHAEEGCAEDTFNDWYESMQQIAEDKQYGLVALQFYDENRPYQLDKNDSAEQIYSNILEITSELETNCPVQDSKKFLYGYSRGSTKTFTVAIQDRKDTAQAIFSSYIADSGSWPVEGPLPETIMQTVINDDYEAFKEARFWLYGDEQYAEDTCNSADAECSPCTEIEYTGKLVASYGGAVDTLYKDNKGTDGIFNVPGGCLSQAINAMFSYIVSF